MQNRNFQDPEQYDDSGYNRRPYELNNGNEGYYNPLPSERGIYENSHRTENLNQPFGNPQAYRQQENFNRHAGPERTAFQRAQIDRYGNGRRGESIARGNYGIPGADRFGNVWYNDPRNHGNTYYGSQYSGQYNERGLAEQFGDEVRSWFGNKDAARRREMDGRHAIGGRQGEWPQANRHYDDEVGQDWERRRDRDYGNRW